PSLDVFFPPPSAPQRSPLSLHDALPISRRSGPSLMFVILRLPTVILSRYGSASEHVCRRPAPYCGFRVHAALIARHPELRRGRQDRKSTRLNSSHLVISYAVFCLKKKNK